MKLGPPDEAEGTQLGPLISQRAPRQGAFVLQEGEGRGRDRRHRRRRFPRSPSELEKGAWIEPTIWTGLPETRRGGPGRDLRSVLPRQPFDTEDEAVSMANDTPYGLAASVWTHEPRRARTASAPQIEVGICWINSWFLRDLRTPFGGAKQSGIGREGGVHSLEFYTELRNVCVKLDAAPDAQVERREANSQVGWDREPGKETEGATK